MMRGRGFTLVELLVVIAVIALLVGILLPSLAGARGTAVRMEGATNIRQLQMANSMHADDHAGRMLPASVDIATTNLHRWHGTREREGMAFESEGGAITPYLEGDGGSEGVRRCPALEIPRGSEREGVDAFEENCGGYGYNAAYLGVEMWTNARGRVVIDRSRGALRARMRDPSRTVAFADCALVTTELIEYSFAEPAWWPQYGVGTWRPDPSVHFRHYGGVANVAWADGHVSAERMEETKPVGIYGGSPSEHGLGWFGDVETNDEWDLD